MKISVITVTRNNLTTLKQTLASVAEQTYAHKEHWVIDGASTDGTVEYLKQIQLDPQYAHLFWISEQDHGIYDAMNKGIKQIHGEVFGFLNADDFFTHPQVLTKLAAVFQTNHVDAVYGDLDYVYPDKTYKIFRKWRSKEVSKNAFLWGWMPAHPTFYMKKKYVKLHGGFRLDLGSAADYEFMLRYLYKYNIKSKHLPEVMVKMRTGGASNESLKGRWKANQMDRKAWIVNGLKPLPFTHIAKPARKVFQFLMK